MAKKTLKQLIKRRHNLIPGGAHTYSKGDDQFPAVAPKVIIRGRGAYVWDENNKKYLDWCMGLRSVSLGHVYGPINKAVSEQMKQGTNFGRPHPVEFELASLIIKTVPYIEMVKFAKNGSTVTTAAVKLARAYTGRKYVVLCKDHPFFSYDDWFIGTTPCDSGIPEEIKNLTLIFNYNDIDSLKRLFKKYPGQIACVIMEVVTTEAPKNNFLRKIQQLCKKNGTILIFDEMITGFRWGIRGAADYYHVKPDLVTYGKGIANGYSVAVLGGRKEIMELGGIYHKKPKVFLISTTHGAETISLKAAIAAVNEMKARKVQNHFWKTGNLLKNGLEKLIKKHNLDSYVQIVGFAPNLSMVFKDKNGKISLPLRTLFLQEIIKRGILFQGYFAISYSHKVKEIKNTLDVFDQVFKFYKPITEGKINYEKYLIGEPTKPVFRKYN